MTEKEGPLIHTYFAYGSNLNRSDLRSRCPGGRPLIAARLEGWRLAFRGVADVEPAPGRAVQGALWSLTEGDLINLDYYEGAPSLYRRRTIEVETASGRLEAITYVMTDASHVDPPSAWYLERIEIGYRDWELPRLELERAVEEAREPADPCQILARSCD